MHEPVLVILAAGMGSRYGGLKQIDPVGTYGELIIDFSIYDALQAGFKKVIFIIKKVNEQVFKEAIGDRISKVIDVTYVYQDLDALPEGYTCPPDRTKPWGTGHALLSCEPVIDVPFAVINADDFYGREAFCKMYNFLKDMPSQDTFDYAMVGYTLHNTLTEHGHVARGVCALNDNYLSSIHERIHIANHEGCIQFLEDDVWTPLDTESIVSMNLWGFAPSLFAPLRTSFTSFLDTHLSTNPLKSEFFIPLIVDQLIKTNISNVEVLYSKDKWYGVTYKEDKPMVVEGIKALQQQGIYPYKLWPTA